MWTKSTDGSAFQIYSYSMLHSHSNQNLLLNDFGVVVADFAKYLENIWPGRFRCETKQTHW